MHYDTVIKAFGSSKHGSSTQVPDCLGGSGKTIRRTGAVATDVEKKDGEKKEETPASPTSGDHEKRVVIMVKKAGEDEAVPVEIERGRGMTVANFKAAAAAKLKLAGAPADLTFVSAGHPEFNNNDAKLAEVLDGFDEEDHVLEVSSSNAADHKEMKANIMNDPTNDKNLSLAARKNFKEYEKQRDDNLKTLQDALGFAVTLNCDYIALNKAATDRGYENRCGEVVWGSLLEHLANGIKKFNQDDLCKETLVEAIKAKHTVIIRNNDSEELPTYNNLRVRNGELVLEFKSDNFWCNVDAIDGEEGLKMLESTL
jgi:hypothetical protein